MSRTRTWYLDLNAAFPADRPIAGLMARLMVLWADAVLEYRAIGTEDEGKGSGFEPLDRLDPIYRRMYFWRSLTITLASGQKLLDRLAADAEFRGWLRDDPGAEARFREAKRTFDRKAQVVIAIRNQVSAHIEESVGEAPKHLSSGSRGFVDVGGPDLLRPRFAFHLLLASLMPNVPEEQQEARMLTLLTDAKAAFEGWINAAFVATELYARHYPLFPQ